MVSISIVIDSEIQQLKQTRNRSIIDNLKGKMFLFPTLPPTNQQPNPEEYNLAVKILEALMEFYLEEKEETEFEKAFLMVKQFYFDYSYLIKGSGKKLYFIGIYLLHLLSNNRITEYCFELEPLQLADFSNDYISFVVETEHCISEGNYNKLLNMRNNISEVNYLFYLNKLSSSVRYQIAKSAEQSFNSINKQELLNLLMLNNNQELLQFIEKEINRGNNDIIWNVEENTVVFKENVKDKGAIPSRKIMTDTAELANEIEKII